MIDVVERKVEFHRMPRPEGAILPYPERAILIFSDGLTLDIGSLCYLRRAPGTRNRKTGRKVELSSLSQLRRHEVRALIAHISEMISESGLRMKTLLGRYFAFSIFIDWCDKNQHSRLFDDETRARAAFRDYIGDLSRQVMQNQLSNQTAVGYQNLVLKVLEDLLNTDKISQGVNLVYPIPNLAVPTSIPDSKSQEIVLAWCKCLLNGLTELVVDQKPYPFALTVPGYLKWPNDRIWLFPTTIWCTTPDSKTRFIYHYNSR